MTSHDTGDWLKCYGHSTVQSPNLDSLAADGCLFANAFCTSPVCTPSRGAMMSGRYPQSNGLMGLIQTPYRWRYHEEDRHFSHILSERGYHTVLFNHQHEAPHDDALGFCERRLVDCGSYKLLTGEHVSTAEETAKAVGAFLREYSGNQKPFYAQVGFFETHTPFDWNGAESYEEFGVEIPPYIIDDENIRRRVSGLQGAIRSLDEAIGHILTVLAETGLDENTIVIFTSDHGVELPRCKWELYDGGIRTGLLMRWPQGGLRGGLVCDWLVSNVELVPTLLGLANLPIPENLQGKSFAPFFRDEDAAPTRDAIFAMMHAANRWTESRCVRTKQYKLIRNFAPGRAPKVPIQLGRSSSQERPVMELYDLTADPHELNNLGWSSDCEQVRHDLNMLLLNWLREVDDPILCGPVVSPYYKMAMADFLSGQYVEIHISTIREVDFGK